MQGCGLPGQLSCQAVYSLRRYANAKPIPPAPDFLFWLFSFVFLIELAGVVFFLYVIFRELVYRREIAPVKKLRAS